MADMCFICPVCGEPLKREGAAYKCSNAHSFDIAKQGYVNLLMSSQSSKKHHGDDKLMVRARRDFLEKGYYRPLLGEICAGVAEMCKSGAFIIDSGCGEGWYSQGVRDYLSAKGVFASFAGVDISKDALIYASKRCSGFLLAVASAFSLPFPDGCADAVLNVFSPLAAKEYCRVLKSGGVLIRAVPLKKHLLSLKELVYDVAYENEPESEEIPGFELVKRAEVKYSLLLGSNEDIQSLFKMTPYYYKTSAADQAKLSGVQSLETQAQFGVLVYKKL